MSPDVAIQAPSSAIPCYANDVEYKVFSKATLPFNLSYFFPWPRSNDTQTMETLPTELHAYICQMGCIDQGASARNLNTVSKYYNQVTKPYLFRNVSAAGIPQCLSLLEQLEARPVNMRQIDRLFLSDTPYKSTSSVSPSPTRLEDNDTRRIIRLITLAAPYLKTFTFISNSPFTSTALISRIFRTSFPLLQKLTISGFYPFPASPGRFPSLTTLHLDGNRNPHGLFLMSLLEEACPKLQNVKITGLGAAGAFVVELEEALAGGEIWDESTDFMMPIRLPPLLCHVVIQAGPVPVVSGPKDNASTKDQILMRRLESLKMKTSSNAHGVKLVVMERRKEFVSVEELRADWLSELSSISIDY